MTYTFKQPIKSKADRLTEYVAGNAIYAAGKNQSVNDMRDQLLKLTQQVDMLTKLLLGSDR